MSGVEGPAPSLWQLARERVLVGVRSAFEDTAGAEPCAESVDTAEYVMEELWPLLRALGARPRVGPSTVAAPAGPPGPLLGVPTLSGPPGPR